MLDSSLSPHCNNSITLHCGRLRDSIGFIFGLTMMLFGVWLITTHRFTIENRITSGTLFCILGGFSVLGSIVEILVYRLELSREGIKIHHINFYCSYAFRWWEISEFHTYRVWGIPFVGFNQLCRWEYRKPSTTESFFPSFFHPFDHSIFIPFGMRTEELTAILNAWKNCYVNTPFYTCPCCGFKTFPEPPGSYHQCIYCGWIDDLTQLLDADASGKNSLTLLQAQKNFLEFGGCEEKFRPHDSSLLDHISRDPSWKPIWEYQTKSFAKENTAKKDAHRNNLTLSQTYYWLQNQQQ